MLAAIMILCGVTAQAQERTMAYPQAEWSKAGDILMHTPGPELFNGVIPDESAEATEAYRQDVLSKMSRADLIRCILMQPIVKLWKTDNNTGYEAVYMLNPLHDSGLAAGGHCYT